jgi:iron complex transport system permease protein
MCLARQLDLLALGERSARHAGVHVERLRIISIVVVAALVAGGVAFAGIIAFVGLVVPHLLRMVLGPGHRALIPASALGGALLMVCADLVARTAVDFADLPIGMLTALVGGPFFFWMLLRTRSAAGGWR